jgi:benzoyl-CoA reductase subunit D
MNHEPLVTAGVDVGTSAVKTAVLRSTGGGAPGVEILALRSDRIRRRDLRKVIDESFRAALAESGLTAEEMAYVASTGEGELVEFRSGHFYGMTTHARGATYLVPEASAVLDVGALHARAMRIDSRSKVLASRMTSQCASGSGQFLENICRYLGITLDEIGPLSLEADDPEACSSICAVLAETDVINMVSRGISTANIIKGIHQSMAGRYLRLLVASGARGSTLVTGGLAADVGLVAAMNETAAAQNATLTVRGHERSVLAGALGAALWGAFRHRKLARKGITLRPS